MRRKKAASRLSVAVRGILLAALVLASSCGLPDGLVTVRVNGLVKEVTALYVMIQLDGVAAKNTKPQTNLEDRTFVVYDEMQRFGVQVPSGTQSLAVSITGYDPYLVALRTGTGSIDVTLGKELEITLQAVPQ